MSWKWDRQQSERAREQAQAARRKNQRKPEPEPDLVVGENGPEKVKFTFNVDTSGISAYVQQAISQTFQFSPNMMRVSFGLPELEPKEPLNLPTRQQAEPIVAYKRAAIKADPLQLYGVGMNAPYGPDDVAVCVKGAGFGPSLWNCGIPGCLQCGNTSEPTTPKADHVAPEPGCTCGFYAMPKERLHTLGFEYGTGIADLEVELYGRIVKHEKGWRAQYQRVLGVYLDPACHVCRRAATSLASDDRVLRPVCDNCTPSPFIPYSSWGDGLRRDPKPVVRFSPADLANAWGVECRWGSIT